MKKQNTINRRQLLRGLGGFTLGIPFLPSLVRTAFANPTPSLPKYFLSYTTPHGGIWDTNWYPPDTALTNTTQILPGHVIRSGPLVPTVSGGNAVLSPVLQAASTKLTTRLAGKLNVLRGLDFGFQYGHHPAGHLGHYATGPQQPVPGNPTPTADQVIAYSSSFYSNLNGVRRRSIETTSYWNGYSVAYYWSNPTTKSGTIQATTPVNGPTKLFTALFGTGVPPGGGTPPAPRPLIVDRVRENYRSLREGDRRLSQEDKVRLDEHLARLDELERELLAAQAGSSNAACTNPSMTGTNLQQINSIIAMAMMCGYTRVANIGMQNETFAAQLPPSAPSWSPATWHNNVAHQWRDPTVQAGLIVPTWQIYFQTVLDLAQKLDSMQVSPGVTLLEQALLLVTSECEEVTHQSLSIPVLTFGNAGGAIKSGFYADYRNLATTALGQGSQSLPTKHSGLTWSRLLATACKAMGVPKSEYETTGPGYGNTYLSSSYAATQVAGTQSQNGDPLPIIG